MYAETATQIYDTFISSQYCNGTSVVWHIAHSVLLMSYVSVTPRSSNEPCAKSILAHSFRTTIWFFHQAVRFGSVLFLVVLFLFVFYPRKVQNQQTRELISARKLTHEHNSKDLWRATVTLTWQESNTRLLFFVLFLNPPKVYPRKVQFDRSITV